MAKEIDINSAEWLELVFEGKNKNYGAYRMRNTSGKRHKNAMIIVFLFVCFIALLPTLIKTIEQLRPKHEAMTEAREMSQIKPLEEQIKQENIVQQQDAPPPPPLKSTIMFTVPEITSEEIPEDQSLLAQDEIVSTKVQISVLTVDGSDADDAVDIADLENHQVIVDDPILVAVEEMPQFPGGDEELMRYIASNLKYPTVAQEMGIEGRVTLRFVVNKNGEVGSVEVVRSLDPLCDKEASRVIKGMPRWIPGRQGGRAVSVYYTIPILFKLNK